MHNQKRSQDLIPQRPCKNNNQIEPLLREAQKSHRAAKTGAITQTLPIIRRIQATGVCDDKSVSRLFTDRQTLQREKFLTILTIEAAYSRRENYKSARFIMPEQTSVHSNCDGNNISNINLCFATEQQAVVILGNLAYGEHS